jgi:hypothetical protein
VGGAFTSPCPLVRSIIPASPDPMVGRNQRSILAWHLVLRPRT